MVSSVLCGPTMSLFCRSLRPTAQVAGSGGVGPWLAGWNMVASCKYPHIGLAWFLEVQGERGQPLRNFEFSQVEFCLGGKGPPG